MRVVVFVPALSALVLSVLAQSPAPNSTAAVAYPDN